MNGSRMCKRLIFITASCSMVLIYTLISVTGINSIVFLAVMFRWAPAACSLFQPQLISCLAGIIEKRIKKSGDKKIGNIWFDSHGHYANGYSSFSIGRDEFNFVNIKDSMYNQSLKCIAKHCDEFTQIVIGSCYGGATFTF